RVCLILDKMNILRDRVYQAFLETIHDKAEVDVYFHHHNFKVFERLVEANLNNYTHFVIVTYFREDPSAVLNKIPPHKRIIIDHNEHDLEGTYSSIYQDHKSDLVDSLGTLLPQLEKYKRLVLIAPLEAFHAKDLIEGFETFATEHEKNYTILHRVETSSFKKGDASITSSRYDQDDVDIIKLCLEKFWTLVTYTGLISNIATAAIEYLV